MMTARDQQLLDDILSKIAAGARLVEGVSLETLAADRRRSCDLLMHLIGISGLTEQLSPELQKAHPDIPWEAISRVHYRNAATGYRFRLEDTYTLFSESLPALARRLRQIRQAEG